MSAASTRIIVLTVALVAVLLATSPSPAGAAAFSRCRLVAFAPHSSDGAFRIIARGTTCRTARAVARGSRGQRFRAGHPRYAALRFVCRGVGEELGGAASRRQ